MIARLPLLLLLTGLPLLADAEQEITAVVSTLASALSANNAELFMKSMDHDMAGFRKLEQDVDALTGNTDINCTIELISTTGTPNVQTAELDWYMALKSQQDENLVERRRTKVTIKIEKRGKKWMVTALGPISVFAPMSAR